MGMLRDLLAVYGCVLGAALIVAGVLMAAFGFVFTLLGGVLYFLLVPAGVFIMAMGALVLYLILREPDPDFWPPPHAPARGQPGAPEKGAVVGPQSQLTPPPAGRLELPSVTVLFLLFLAGTAAGTIALYYGSIWIFLVPCLLAATMPPLMWIRFVHGQGVAEPPPRRFVLMALTGGMLSVIPVFFINTLAGAGILISLDPLAEAATSWWVMVLVPVVVAPLVEEAFKPVTLLAARDEMYSGYDGLLLGVTAGMGFALLENIAYLTVTVSFFLTEAESAGDAALFWGFTALARGLGSVGIHGVGTGVIGYAYARKVRGLGGTEGVIAAYLIAVLVHAGWNGLSTLLLVDAFQGAAGVLAVMALLVVFAASVFLFLVTRVKAAVRDDSLGYPPGSKTEDRNERALKKMQVKLYMQWQKYYRAQAQRYYSSLPPGYPPHGPQPGPGYPPRGGLYPPPPGYPHEYYRHKRQGGPRGRGKGREGPSGGDEGRAGGKKSGSEPDGRKRSRDRPRGIGERGRKGVEDTERRPRPSGPDEDKKYRRKRSSATMERVE